jgi:hypothetical protein
LFCDLSRLRADPSGDFLADGTFVAEAEDEQPAASHRISTKTLLTAALCGVAALGAVATVSNMSSPKAMPVETLQKARQQQLAWSGFTYAMQDEADKVFSDSGVYLALKNVM